MDNSNWQEVTPIEEKESLRDTLIFISKIGCSVVILLSILVLVGWFTNSSFLKSILPGFPAMNPIEAVGLIFAGLALFIRLQKEEISVNNLIICNILCVLVFAIGFLTLLNLFFGFNFSIDNILFAEKLGNSQISPNSALNFVLIGIGFLIVKRKFYSFYRLTQICFLMAGLVTMVAGIGYIYNALAFYQVYTFSPMPLNTTLAYAFLCACALISTQNYGIMKILTSDYAISSLARKLILTTILVPIFLGGIKILTQKFIDPQLSTAFIAVFQIIIFTVIIWTVTKRLYKSAQERYELIAILKDKNQELEIKDKNLSDKIIELDKANSKISDLLNNEQKLKDIVDQG